MRFFRTPFAAAVWLTALIATFVFKIALFAYAASGAEGATSALLTWPRIVLCLGWDVLASVFVAVFTIVCLAPLRARWPRLASGAAAALLAVYAVFLLVSYTLR